MTATTASAPSSVSPSASAPAEPNAAAAPDAQQGHPPTTTVERLLRDGEGLRATIDAGHDHAELARDLIGIILLGAGLLGAVLGSFRGGVQIPFAAIKLPLVVLLTAAVCTPALSVIRRALGRSTVGGPAGLQLLGRDIVLLLASLALGVLIAASMAPLVLLGMALHLPYHELILITFGACGIGGLAGLAFLYRGVRSDGGGASVLAALILVVVLVGGQMAWIGRPYLVRPKTPEPPFLRSSEGSLTEALGGTIDTLASDAAAEVIDLRGGGR